MHLYQNDVTLIGATETGLEKVDQRHAQVAQCGAL
jgi:hypothetical protein